MERIQDIALKSLVIACLVVAVVAFIGIIKTTVPTRPHELEEVKIVNLEPIHCDTRFKVGDIRGVDKICTVIVDYGF